MQGKPKEPKQKLKFEILQFSEDKIDSSNGQVKNELKEPKRELTYEILKFSEDESESSDMCDDTEEDTCNTQEEISFRGHRKYINPNVFADLEPEKRSAVPIDIDGVCIFTVPMLKNGSLDNCKGGRPWGRAISSNLSGKKKGQRLLFNCKGSYICSDANCPSVADFGLNRTDFEERNGEAVCDICGSVARYIRCDARLITEREFERNTVIVKHYGCHTCRTMKRGRMDKNDIKLIFDSFPKATREGLIRQKVQQHIETGDIERAKESAKQLTDTKFIDNVKQKSKQSRRPDGHSFQAVKIQKEKFDGYDNFLIYDYNDGSDGNAEFVVKSSRLKVNFLLNLDRSGSHPLSSETVHLDVIHSRCKMWKTYTLSFYCKLLREMVKLVTMECKKECAENCRLFFMQVNKMIRDLSGDAHLCFNPHHIKDDEHGGNKIGIADVLGVDALSRTTSCDFHYDSSTKVHKKFVRKCDRKLYKKIALELKNSVTPEGYKAALQKMKDFIQMQQAGDQKPLLDALEL